MELPLFILHYCNIPFIFLWSHSEKHKVLFLFPSQIMLFCNSFPVDQGDTVKSVVQYFQETYGYTIQHTYLPCLQVGNQQRPNYLPMEVC
jgi:hypothetical protein